jgi:xanthine dehydrogenase YagT iron-sulfur-binding subunit
VDTEPAHVVPVTLRVNGDPRRIEIDTRASLLDVLREQLGLTGAKKGCDHGQCGACTVLLGGRRANACLLLAVACDELEVTTIEGLAGPDGLHPVQEAFVAHDGFQCGYCTPGQICSAVGMLEEARAEGVVLEEDEVGERMSGNICRCGAYPGIVAAILETAR